MKVLEAFSRNWIGRTHLRLEKQKNHYALVALADNLIHGIYNG